MLIYNPLINPTLEANNLFSSECTNGSNKLECYIALDWKGLPGTTPAYWANYKIRGKLSVVNQWVENQ